MQRSAAEMATLLDALLLIARSSESTDATNGSVELAPALASVIAEFRGELDAAYIAIGVRCAHSARVQAPPELLRVVLRLLFRSIASGAYGTSLRLDADTRGIVLASADSDATAPATEAAVQNVLTDEPASNGNRDDAALRSDQTGGTGMLRRLCQRYGWALELAHDPTEPILLSLRFWSPDAAPTGPHA